jgi:hypothetical protein
VQDGSGNSVTATDREIKDYGSAELQQKLTPAACFIRSLA